jgi:hypothetical protein
MQGSKTGAVKDLISLKAITDGFIIDENDQPAAIYELKGGLNTYIAATQSINNALEGLKTAFNTLKPGEEVQIIVSARQYNPDQLIARYNDLVKTDHPVEHFQSYYPKVLEKYISSWCTDNRVLDYKFYVLFTYTAPEIILRDFFFSKKKDARKDIDALKRDIGLRSRNFIGALKQAGVDVVDLDRYQIKDIVEKALNPVIKNGVPLEKIENSMNEFKSMLARTPLVESHDKIMLGNEYVKTIYISDIPNSLGLMQNLFFKFNYFTLSIFARGINQFDIKDDLKKKLKAAHGTGGGQTDIENREIEIATDYLLGMLARNEVKLIKYACYLSFKHEELQTLEEIAPDFEGALQECVPFSGMFEQKALWLSTLPFCRNMAGHSYLTLTGDGGAVSGGLSNLYPFYNFSVDNEEGGALIGTTLNHQPVLYNPWSKKLINGNHVIIGQPGSGKSFYVNLILNRLSPWMPEVIIIDKSKSYEITCAVNSGQYIKIGLGGENSYNVFDCMDYDDSLGEDNDINIKGEPTAGKISFISGMFDIILAEEGERRLNKLDSSLIEEIIKQIYKNNMKVNEKGIIDRGSVPTLGSSIPAIENMIKNKKFVEWKIDLSRISQKLSPFIGAGTYATLLDRPSNLTLKSHFIVFDISNLPDRDDIQSLAVYIISSFSMQRFKINKKLVKKQILCIDEAWYLARFTGGHNFLLELAKRSRHLGLMALTATQQIGDFLGQPEAAQILKSAATMTLFKQSPTDLENLKNFLNLNSTEAAVIAGLSQERGKYSQAFYISGDIKNTICIRPDPVSRWIATSEPTHDVPARNNELKKTNNNYWQAILNLAEKGA